LGSEKGTDEHNDQNAQERKIVTNIEGLVWQKVHREQVGVLCNTPEKAQVGQKGKSGAGRDAWQCS